MRGLITIAKQESPEIAAGIDNRRREGMKEDTQTFYCLWASCGGRGNVMIG